MDMTFGIEGKTAIVTGAGRGIGRAVARRLSAGGANVVLAARTASELEESRRLIERDCGRALAIPADVSQVADVERLVEEAMNVYGRVDILVNNAGTAPLATIDQMEPMMFDRIVATNCRTVYLCSRCVWPIFAEAGGGLIVNIASVAAYDAFPGLAAYGAAKAFVVAYTRFLADEGKSLGIRVYGVAPGAVETQMLRNVAPDFPEAETLEPDEVAEMVAVMLSPACRHSSGQTVMVRKGA